MSDAPPAQTRPRVVAVIPARGGSQGVPLKNLEPVGGRSLLMRAVTACRQSQLIDEVYVSTDHAGIQEEARRAGAHVVVRPAAISGNTASSESAVLHAINEIQGDGPAPEVTVLVQCTSPFMNPADLDAAVGRVLAGEADCAFSAVESHAFLWKYGPDGLIGINHDASFRPRRQDRDTEFRETGAFYAMRTDGLRRHGRRFFGTLVAQRVNDDHAMEIDTPDDLHIARLRAAVLEEQERIDGLPVIDVDALVMDFDGVHTDDSSIVLQDGTESVRVSREDGMGIKLARQAGLKMLILSTEVNPVVAARGRKLQIPVIHGQSDKAQALKEWLAAEGLDPERVAYVGNDVNDLGCLRMVGWPIAVANAHSDVMALARLTLTKSGGYGAVREVCELVISAINEREAGRA
ncbi:acylneuraminate cytidylyltransferase [Kineosporia rhizophila]|uniref:acylneuraminate cytidylyltransferase n=1 Tax=Kineosporia TaxID=49184 RepID=UPI001E49137E|nr:acylneuraminate cytidylyltransferase [Kineosporia sp. NBRC 101677]MCE0534009.1 acylneuraminate cytidylyltransferase [Kineosporia rhizophila]GLY13549.1 transferase [Kineosporia sp. NBRC 101677]